MVNPGSFQGARKAFLLSQKPEYEAAVKDHQAAEMISLIQRRFFKRFPIDLPDDYEPTEAQLALIDDDAPDAEVDPGTPSESENDTGSSSRKKKKAKKAKKNSKSRKNRIAFRREQIKRWMAYQYAKDNSIKEKENGAFNPYKILLPRFFPGINNPEPRRKPALNIWRKTKRDEINAILKTQIQQAEAAGDPIPSSHFATRRESIARSLFDGLSGDEKQQWENEADEQHALAKAQHKLENEQAIPTSPADRQRAIQLLPSFIQPVLDLVNDVTGWKSSYLGGGPEPALNGQFSVMSVHSGTTTGPVPMNFGCAERTNYKKHFIPSFGKFLQGCFDPDECKSRALDPQEGFLPMSAVMESNDPQTNPSAFMYDVDQTPLPLGPTFTMADSALLPALDDETSHSEDEDNPYPINYLSSPRNSPPPSPTASVHGSTRNSPSPSQAASVCGSIRNSPPPSPAVSVHGLPNTQPVTHGANSLKAAPCPLSDPFSDHSDHSLATPQPAIHSTGPTSALPPVNNPPSIPLDPALLATSPAREPEAHPNETIKQPAADKKRTRDVDNTSLPKPKKKRNKKTVSTPTLPTHAASAPSSNLGGTVPNAASPSDVVPEARSIGIAKRVRTKSARALAMEGSDAEVGSTSVAVTVPPSNIGAILPSPSDNLVTVPHSDTGATHTNAVSGGSEAMASEIGPAKRVRTKSARALAMEDSEKPRGSVKKTVRGENKENGRKAMQGMP